MIVLFNLMFSGKEVRTMQPSSQAAKQAPPNNSNNNIKQQKQYSRWKDLNYFCTFTSFMNAYETFSLLQLDLYIIFLDKILVKLLIHQLTP